MKRLDWRLLAIGAAAACLPILAGVPARADIFKLAGGGEVRGELANPAETPRVEYVIHPFSGGELKLAAAQVSEVVSQKPVEAEYEKARLQAGDTVDDQWKLAEWCRQHNLTNERKTHMEKILALEPDHAEARRLLGYEKKGERWLTRDQIMLEEGRVKYKGRWRLATDVEDAKRRDAESLTQKKWFAQIKLWRMWLDGDKASAGRRNILEIQDKAADHPLAVSLKSEKDYRVRELYAQALGNLGTPESVKALVTCTLEDPNENFRLTCLDVIEKAKPAAAFDLYVKALKSRDSNRDSNAEVNRAAMGLARLGDAKAVSPLIDALITRHTYLVGAGQPGQLTPTFSRDSSGNGGAGLGVGGGPKYISRDIRNQEVLAALAKLTGQDFDYNVNAWKYWFASTTKKDKGPINLRRN